MSEHRRCSRNGSGYPVALGALVILLGFLRTAPGEPPPRLPTGAASRPGGESPSPAAGAPPEGVGYCGSTGLEFLVSPALLGFLRRRRMGNSGGRNA